jgi:hypothetical protein
MELFIVVLAVYLIIGFIGIVAFDQIAQAAL